MNLEVSHTVVSQGPPDPVLTGTNIKHITTLRVYNMLRTFKTQMWHYILHINYVCVKWCCAHRVATKSADSDAYIAHNLRYMIASGEFKVTHRDTWDGTNTE